MRKLINKSYKQYEKISRYAVIPNYYNVVTDRYVGGTTAYLDDNVPYSIYVVKRGDTLDKLALYFYNNPTLYWIICSFNRIQNPYADLVEGVELKIPSISNLKFLI